MKEITASVLNIRSQPTTSSVIVGQLNRGSIVSVIEQKGDWIRFDKGWIHGGYTRDKYPIKRVITFVAALNIRKEPSVNSIRKSFYPKDTIVDVFDIKNGWYLTKDGWISGNFTKELDPPKGVLKPNYEYIVDHIPFSNQKRPGKQYAKYNFKANGITIHNTANPRSNALNERGWLTNSSNNRTASWHIAVDDVRAVEAIPLNEISWHAGSFQGNNTTIGIEICEPQHDKAMHNAIHLTARLMRENKWDMDKLYTHQMWSGKYCPNVILNNGLWGYFVNEVEKQL